MRCKSARVPVNVTLNGEALATRRIDGIAQRLAAGLVFRNAARGPVWRTTALSGAPREAPPSMQAGYTINKTIYRFDGSLADLGSIRQGDRVVVVLSGQPEGARNFPTVAGRSVAGWLGDRNVAQSERWRWSHEL